MAEPSKPCIMVVNQGIMTGTGLVDALNQANYRVAGPFSECSDASHWLASGTPHGALLDMLLTDDTCFELARDLRARGVPYLFHSSSRQPDGGRGSARVEPVPSFNALLNAMSELIRHSANGTGA
jgi:hypothetical protein